MKNMIIVLLVLFTILKTVLFAPNTGFSEEISMPVINEVMASNTTAFRDEDSEYPDWIEIYNPGDSSINLKGYGLSDRPGNPYKWIFPGVKLESEQYMIVFASGKNRAKFSKHWETVIYHGDVWRYFIGTSEPPENWHSLEFNDSEWISGPTSIGSRNDDTTIITRSISLYLRKKFAVDNVENINNSLLQIDYQDGFVAYINGNEIARANIAETGIPPPYNENATDFRNMQILKGGNPDVFEIENIRDFLLPGENILAIQVHNKLAITDISITSFLTFGMTNPPQNPIGVPDILDFSIPSSIFHTNYKINADGETLVLTDSFGTLCDSLYTGTIANDISLGRKPDGGPDWLFFYEPTPGESNSTEGFQGFTDTVVEMSLPGGFYDTGISMELSTDSQTAKIRYTLDGADPIKSSMLYYTPIAVDTATVIKARAFETGLFPGSISTNTYFITANSTLPVISISTPPENLFDDEIGIYVEGSGDIPNYKQDWERPVHVEFYEPGGTPGFKIDAGVKILGGIIRMYPQKSLAIFARNKYGYNKINYKIFPDLPIPEFKSIVLRNSGNDWRYTRFRDALCQSLVKDIDVDIQGYRPVVVYLNGVYWGIQNIREKLNEDYLASHHGIDPNNVDILENQWTMDGTVVVEGDAEHYHAMIDYITNNDISDSENYKYLKTQMEIDNFIDYNVAEIYCANTDWPEWNVRFWRPRTQDGRWRWIFSDIDFGFDMYNKGMYSHNTLSYATASNSSSGRNPPWSTFLLRKLLENENFKKDFINRFADFFNTIFKLDVVKQTIAEIKTVLEPEMPNHINRWKEEMGVLKSMSEWYDNIQVIENFAEKREEAVKSHIMNKFNLSGMANININVSSSDAGKIKINSLIIDDYPWDGIYFKDVPVQVTALPNLGYQFTGWTGLTPEDSLAAAITLTEDISVTANFEKIGDDVVLANAGSPYTIQSTQTIASGKSLNVDAGVELVLSKDTNICVNGEIHLNGTADNPITIRPADDARNWGAICLENASGSSTLSHVIIRGASSGTDMKKFPATISGYASDITIENVEFDGNVQGIFARGGSVTVRNCLFTETNMNEPINIKEAEALVENCRFMYVFGEDGIDYDGVHDGIIRNNEIFASNDDGIDIGDDCSNVLITGNVIYNCVDKGISVGEGSKDIRIEKNIIADCAYGIAVKDSSNAFIDHNTLYGNDIAVVAFEKGVRRFGGGTAVVTNSILSQSSSSALMTDELSSITVSYSLADTESLPGDGNIMADPLLASPLSKLFNLLAGSPAIDAGDPQSDSDPDGSRSDIGAFYYKAAETDIVINEINYNSLTAINPGDWVELYNPHDSSVDISGWVFKDADDANEFVLPDNTVIPPGGYLVLCNDKASFHTVFPDVENYIGDLGYNLSNGGELIRLYNNQGALVDWLTYDDAAPWPVEPDGTGCTLALRDPNSDNSLPENWTYSNNYGTPGAVNDWMSDVDKIEVPIAFSLGQNYPNPFNPMTCIRFSISKPDNVLLQIYDIRGAFVKTLVDHHYDDGSFEVIWDGINDKGKTMASGIYFYRIKTGANVLAKKLLLLR